MKKIKSKIISAFCGTGKSYIINKYPNSCIEFECWKYISEDFPNNYIDDIKHAIGIYEYIFISTNPITLNFLKDYNIYLIYPNINLKSEYINRYKERGSDESFISMLDMNWNKWIYEIKENKDFKHIVLQKGEFLENKINI